MNTRIISPSLSDLPKDELGSLARSLYNDLPTEWEIYVRPFLNGERPGIVLLNQSVGLVILEVFCIDETRLNHVCEEINTKKSKSNDVLKDLSLLIERLTYTKKVIHDLYCPRLGTQSRYNNIYSVVVFMNCAQAILDNQLKQAMGSFFVTPSWRYPNHSFLGKETIKSQSLLIQKIPLLGATPHSAMACDLAKDLRNWLVEPYFSETERRPLRPDEKQKELITTRTQSGYRRMKGPAGSGKSLVLAARAAELCLAGKRVLVVSFNITLLEYLRRLSERYARFDLRKHTGPPLPITYMNYHELCKKLFILSGEILSYQELWRELYQDFDEEEFAKRKQEVLNSKLTDLINAKVINNGAPPQFQYDAILVDEGQDFLPQWWDMLRKLLVEGGEMLLSADLTQNVYGTASNWTDESMRGAGFAGDWVRLDKSYRLPNELIEFTSKFADEYLPSEGLDKPVADKQLFTECELRWIQTSSEKLEKLCVHEALSLVTKVKDEKVAITDVTVLVPKTEIGLSIVKQIEDEGVKVISIFTNDRNERRSMKMSFSMQEAKVKVTTVHSFKGWESRAIVLLVNECSTTREKAVFYTGMTRVVKHDRGSYLTVVSASPDLEAFGRTWPRFEKK